MLFHMGVCEVSDVYVENVKEFRRRAHGIGLSRLVFVDQTNLNESMRPLYGLAPRGKPSLVSTRSAPRYSPRVDVTGACYGHGVLSLKAMTPEERSRFGVKGWTKSLILSWMRNELARDIDMLDLQNMVVVLDKGLSITATEVLNSIHEGGCSNVTEVWIMETGIAKHVSPLDNTLWHDWKERIRKREPISELSLIRICKQEWLRTSVPHLEGYYRKCALTRGTNISYDL
jgi:hypothetical protein